MRIVVPGYPAFNIYFSYCQDDHGPWAICVASVVNEMERWDVEVIDENNLRRYGPKSPSGVADHEFYSA